MSSGANPTKASKNLEFLRQNPEFLMINLEFLEIASVALLPRNNAGNSRIPYRDPRVKPEDDIVGNSKIP